MKYTTITIQGNIITSDLLEKIRLEDIRFQQPADFGLDRNTTVRDEIGIAWAAAKAHWQAFSLRRDRLKDDESGASETRRSWMIPCLRELGYDLDVAKAELINNKTYAISHRATNRGGFPAHIVGINQSLDKRAESADGGFVGPRLSPHALAQEYINNTEHLYALVSNGRYLRLLRDATRLSRLSYLEFDLERMMTEDQFAEFALLFRLLHATRMPADQASGEDAIIEFYHQEALASGSRIREKLSEAVEQSLKELANGLLKHPANDELRQQITDNRLKPDDFYLHLLRLVYRLLFLMVIEERHLIYADDDAESVRLRDIYYRYYSIGRLTALAEKRIYVDPRKTDLWRSLLTTFHLFETDYYGEKLGIKPLGAGLFAPNALGELSDQQLDNHTLLTVLYRFITFENEHKQRVHVNYADLDVEEFGSVYEGLLEYDPEFRDLNGQPVFTFVAGSQRSSSGSHYTPEELVKPLIEHSLDHLIEDRLAQPERFSPLKKGARGDISSPLSGRGARRDIISPLSGRGARGDISSPLSGRGARGEGYKIPPSLLANARELRQKQTPAEEFLWQILRNRQFQNLKFRRQHPIERYVLDFYCHELQLGIELDGEGHKQPDQKAIDQEKERFLKEQGITVIRFWNAVVLNETEKVLGKIASFLPSPPAPLPGGEGRKALQERALLSLKIADVAAGSGHILLSAARRVGLALARVRSGEDQPSPPVMRQAVRDVIRNCLYGVDKNPLAVELCMVALWLEAHTPGQPLNFLDHRIKCGDAIVGVARAEELKNGIPDEAFATLPGDDKAVAKTFRDQNKKERINPAQISLSFEKTVSDPLGNVLDRLQKVEAMPETTPTEIEAKAAAYDRLMHGDAYYNLRTLADLQTAPFFIPKTEANTPHLLTDAAYRQCMIGEMSLRQNLPAARALAVSAERRFFHYFLEFPEVFAPSTSSGQAPSTSSGPAGQAGFDCVLGNPPFLGNRKIKGTFGDDYLNWLTTCYAPAGAVDIVAYFFRRIFGLLTKGGFQSLIATNTIAQGGAREGGLAVILQQGGTINHAVRSMRWPGLAAVEVALVTVHKGRWDKPVVLDRKPAPQITSYLDDTEPLGDPYPLKQNENKSFQGSIVLGKGFVLTPEQAQALIAKDPKNRDVLFPYLNGEDLNSNPDQSPSRWVINFHDWPLDREWDHQQKKPQGPPYAVDYPDCFEIVRRDVKPERDKLGQKKDASSQAYARLWWKHGRRAIDLYATIAPLERVLVRTQASKYNVYALLPNTYVFDQKVVVFSIKRYSVFSILSSIFQEEWAWKYSATLGGSTLNYSPTKCFENFPFPQTLSPEQEAELERLGHTYYAHRQQLMRPLHVGLTKLYNQFHNPALRELSPAELSAAAELSPKDFTKHYGKETWNLWSHLNTMSTTSQVADISSAYNEAVQGILRLRELHVAMDQAVLAAYGWADSPLAQLPLSVSQTLT